MKMLSRLTPLCPVFLGAFSKIFCYQISRDYQRFTIIIDWVFGIYTTSPIGIILIDKRMTRFENNCVM